MEYAGVGRRAVAIIIDGIIIGVVMGIIGGIVSAGAMAGAQTPEAATAAAGMASVVYGILGILAFVYYIVLEATMGATLGKKVMGLMVVKSDGTPITWGASIIRNLLRIIDVLPTAYLLGAILAWTSPQKQRLGDRAASTVVVRAGTETRVAMA